MFLVSTGVQRPFLFVPREPAMLSKEERQATRTDKQGHSRFIEYRAGDLAGDSAMEPSEPNP